MGDPEESKLILGGSDAGFDSNILRALCVLRGKSKIRLLNHGEHRGHGGSHVYVVAFRLFRFQYKYPGTPISIIAVPQKASVGRVKIVFNVHAVPIST